MSNFIKRIYDAMLSQMQNEECKMQNGTLFYAFPFGEGGTSKASDG
jgi:hypothetical protein